MAFASTSKHLPRESVYPTPPSSDYLNALEDCVQATEACSRSLQIGLDRFEPGVKDLPRLTKIFKHKHVSALQCRNPCCAMLTTIMELALLVLPEPTIAAHKAALSHSLAPQIDHLIAKTDSMVESEKTKVGNLEERVRVLGSNMCCTIRG